jgi:hypothetical protein
MMKMIQFKKPPTANAQRPTSNGVGGGGRWRLEVSKLPLFCRALLALLAGATFAAAQSNNVPGATDYGRFSAFITERNIFNPNRYPHYNRPPPPPPPRFTPQFTLVGTMSYTKGMFAFFDGNDSNLRKVLYPTDTNGIAGFVVADITATNVTLQSADKKRTVPLSIGQSMRQEGGAWQLASQGGYLERTSSRESATPATDSASPDTSAGASNSALEGNDVLKRLMQQRQQEIK